MALEKHPWGIVPLEVVRVDRLALPFGSDVIADRGAEVRQRLREYKIGIEEHEGEDKRDGRSEAYDLDEGRDTEGHEEREDRCDNHEDPIKWVVAADEAQDERR